jgi:hypothetical protein
MSSILPVFHRIIILKREKGSRSASLQVTPLSVRHRAAFGNEITLPAAQGPAAEVPAGGRAVFVDGTGPLPDPFVISLLHVKVPAGGIGKEKTVRFPEAPLTEVLQLVGFALPDKSDGEPAAALTAATAGTTLGVWPGLFHHHRRLAFERSMVSSSSKK